MRTTVRGRIVRQVGQLDFANFVSVASLADDQLSGGNPDLRPQASWRGEAGVDIRPGADAAIGVTLFRDWIDNVVDWTPLGVLGSPELRERRFFEDGRTDGLTGIEFTRRNPAHWWLVTLSGSF